MDRIAHGVAKSQTRLSDLRFHFHPAQKLSVNYRLPLHLHHCVYYSCVLRSVAQSTLCDPMDCSSQAPLSMEFSGKNIRAGCHFFL